MQVDDPSGDSWRIKRRWLPWRWRRRDPDDLVNLPDSADIGDDWVIGLAIFVAILLVLVFVPLVLVLAVAVAELLALFLLFPLFIALRAGRVARWPIEAWQGDQLVLAEAIRGWGSSRLRMHELADDIRLGRFRPASLPDDDGGAV